MGWFGTKVVVSVHDGKGGVRKIRVSEKQFQEWEAQGKLTPVATVHIVDAIRPERTETWELGKQVSCELYEKYKEPNGDLYVSIHYQNGQPQVNLATKQAWEMIKAAMDSAGQWR